MSANLARHVLVMIATLAHHVLVMVASLASHFADIIKTDDILSRSIV